MKSDLLQSFIEVVPSDHPHATQLLMHIFQGFTKTASAHDIMKFIKEQGFPGLMEGFLFVWQIQLFCCDSHHFFGIHQFGFRMFVSLFSRPVSGITSAGVMLQIAPDHRNPISVLFQFSKIFFRVGKKKERIFLHHLPKLFQCCMGWSAAMITHTVEDHQRKIQAIAFTADLIDLLWEILSIHSTGVFCHDSLCQHPAAIRAFPPEHRRKMLFMLTRPHHNIIFHSAFCKKLRNTGIMSEGVHIIPDFRGMVQKLFQKSLSQ